MQSSVASVGTLTLHNHRCHQLQKVPDANCIPKKWSQLMSNLLFNKARLWPQGPRFQQTAVVSASAYSLYLISVTPFVIRNTNFPLKEVSFPNKSNCY